MTGMRPAPSIDQRCEGPGGSFYLPATGSSTTEAAAAIQAAQTMEHAPSATAQQASVPMSGIQIGRIILFRNLNLPMRPMSRILAGLAALLLLVNLVQPIWRIDLLAPQYPEGLVLQIFHDRFTGNVDQINGLNHYIGMATIHNEMFPEFAIMRYVIGMLAIWGVLAALVGRRWALASWLFGMLAFVLWAMWDMYSWGWNYGHNLDPNAAIKIEGMSYQPPLFGHKTLLNFEAWSFPDVGGYVLFAAITLGVAVFIYEWRRSFISAIRNERA